LCRQRFPILRLSEPKYSDYYCLVIGGRYGSLDADGIGYTEKEFDHAQSLGKPIMAFLHKHPGTIPCAQTEQTGAGRAKLDAFAKIEASHHCKYWTSADELGGQVSRSLIVLRRSFLAEGWVRGKFAADDSLLVENATLRARVSQLEAQLVVSGSKDKIQPAPDLARGGDVYSAQASFKLEGDEEYTDGHINIAWDTILEYVGPSLLGECTQEQLEGKLNLCLYHAIQRYPNWKKVDHSDIVIPIVVRDAIVVQLRALGQMAPGTKRRAVSDQKVYWRLTEEGEARLLQTQAIKRPAEPQA
jgi:hypothetical protein